MIHGRQTQSWSSTYELGLESIFISSSVSGSTSSGTGSLAGAEEVLAAAFPP